MVYNVDLLMHLIDSVRNFGPIWSFSLFPYENYNGILKSFVKGTKETVAEISTKFLITHHLNFNTNCEGLNIDILILKASVKKCSDLVVESIHYQNVSFF